ncbi:MAGE-domain-containing protein [Aspergillus alliaceus]|uniref:MAGE-domain-containing protein n=1 Tax=Petromyces alliaceus TaxID=209559 RepID=UPI0012A59AA4|nr:MAGE-domain-containing protein [Aspergillus alliaceus]KAB8237897.1 MAGE-domain-containing protein [Aspergillus alliaceus]
MPHAEPKKMGENAVNGEKVYSHFLDHLTSYPIVSDSITVFKSNKYGAKSIQYADQGYDRIAKPVLPYFSKPYGYIAPYVARADSLGDQGLTQIDSRFPIVKQNTETIKGTLYDNATYPVRLVGGVKSHVFDTYGSEYKKCGGDGVVASGKALITTSLVLSQESLGFISSLLQAKKEQVKDADPSPSPDEPFPEPSQQPRRRRPDENPSSSESNAGDDDDNDDDDSTHHPSSTDLMVKKMVRFALASEYSRLPIRRTEISTKVLGEQGARQFKAVFEAAQKALREKFGMQMVELPGREKVTIHQRRAAQKVEKPSSTNKSWIVTSTLPAAYRKPGILPPTKAPWESTYTGLYSFIISVIMLNGGALPEQKLDRYLARMNAETYTPIDRTDRFLQRLCKEGYLVRMREMDGGEEVIEYMVGPRGKVEVGPQGVAGLVREVYGRQAVVEDGDTTVAEREQMDGFEMRLARSLGIQGPERREEQNANEDAEEGETQERRQSQRRTRPAESDDEDSDE